MAINFVVPADGKFLMEVEKFYNTKIDEMPLDISKLMEDWFSFIFNNKIKTDYLIYLNYNLIFSL